MTELDLEDEGEVNAWVDDSGDSWVLVLAEHHEETLPVAPAVAWFVVTGLVAFSCSLFTLGFWTLFVRVRVSGKRLPRALASIYGCFWKNFSYHLVIS